MLPRKAQANRSNNKWSLATRTAMSCFNSSWPGVEYMGVAQTAVLSLREVTQYKNVVRGIICAPNIMDSFVEIHILE